MEEKALLQSFIDPETVKVGLHCVLGPDRGKFFPFSGERMVVGRGRTADVKVSDINCSREHFEIVRLKDKFVLTDLRSQNGTMVNDDRVKQIKLSHNDKIAFGSTVLSFYLAKETNFEESSDSHRKVAVPRKISLTAILVVIAVAYVLLFLGGDNSGERQETELNQPIALNNQLREVNAGLRQQTQKSSNLAQREQERSIQIILNRGLREMREKNYFRAISEFNHALELSPGHPKASFYLNKANDELNSVIEQYQLLAVRDRESLQYQKALVSYCAILRLLYNFPDSPQYKETKKRIAEIDKILEIGPGENSCN